MSSRKRTYLNFLLCLALLLLGLAPGMGHLSRVFSHALSDDPVMWVDEGSVYEPIQKVYEGGYFDFRCRADLGGTCYGGSQSLLDGYFLKLLPKSFVEADTISIGNGTYWPWVAKYPNALKALRVSRGVFGLAIGILIGIIAWRPKEPYLALILGMIAASSPAFFDAWQGLKNDYPVIAWQILFIWLAFLSLKEKDDRRRFRLFIGAFSMGVFANLTRPSLVPLQFFITLNYFFLLLLDRVRLSVIFIRVIAIFGLAIAEYLILNPNTFASALEARWILVITSVVSVLPFDKNRIPGELHLAWLCLWPALLFLTVLVFYISEKGVRLASRHWLGMSAAVGAMAILNFRICLVIPRYYLSPLVGLLVMTALMLREMKKVPRVLSLSFVVLFFVSLIPKIPELPKDWAQVKVPQGSVVHGLDRRLNLDPDSSHHTWIIDTLVRAPLRKTGILRNPNLKFFDSLSEGPWEVLGGHQDQSALVLVACWKKSNSGDNQIESPISDQWSAITTQVCSEKIPVTTDLYKNGLVPGQYAIARVGDLQNRMNQVPKVPRFSGENLSLRMFKGSSLGMDRYEWTGIELKKDTDLSAEFAFEKGARKATVNVESGCFGPGQLVLETTVQGKAARAARSIDMTPVLCEHRPSLCTLDAFKRWTGHRYEIPVELDVNIKPGDIAKILIKTERKGPKNCSLVFSGMKFDSALGSAKASTN